MRSEVSDSPPGLATDNRLASLFHAFIRDQSFPCVGAKSALARDQIQIVIGRDIRSNWDDLRILPMLTAFAQAYAVNPLLFQSFVVIFEEPDRMPEAAFEACLWERLQSLTDKDSFFGAKVDDRVASDPTDHNFSLSFGGEAFFVVGLHPCASRPARRFAKPALVFNTHDQFIRLRNSGAYEKMRQTIIDRDIALAGSSNPMLSRHGDSSEARQYSGRAVQDDWKCPFARQDFVWPAAENYSK